MATTLITIANHGPGAIMLAGTYLEAGESREVTEEQLNAAKADHPDHGDWFHEVSRRTETDKPAAPDPSAGTTAADLGVAAAKPEPTAKAK